MRRTLPTTVHSVCRIALPLGLSLWVPYPTASLEGQQAPPPAERPVPRFDDDDCPFDGEELPEGPSLRCGWLTVWQNRTHPERGMLRLAVALIPPSDSARSPAADPLVFLSGGPGAAAVRFAPLIARSAGWRELHPDRTLIVYDQRGTGYSEPPFCPELDRDVRREQYGARSRAEALEAGRRSLALCREALLAAGVDLSAYNSPSSALDLDDLRRVLGYDRWNLLGGSYGTRLALTAMRDTPDGIRSVILDSTTPPDAASGHWSSYADDLARSLRLVFDQCAADGSCRKAHPTLEEDLHVMIEELERDPVVVPLEDSVRFPDGRIVVDGTLMTSGIQQALYDARLIPLIPLIVREIRGGNGALLEALAEAVAPEPAVMSVALNNAVECYEVAPFASAESMMEERARHPRFAAWYDDPFTFDNLSLCDALHTERAPAGVGEPVVSDLPTLVLAGEFDPITPPHNGRLAAETLPRSTFVEIRGIGHGAVTSSPCARRIAVAFVGNPEVTPPTSCADSVPALEFATDVRIAPGVLRAGRILERGLPLGWSVGAGAALLVWLSALLGWPIAALVRRRHAGPDSRGGAAARWIAAIAMLVGLGFVGGLGVAMGRTAAANPYLLAFGLPGEWAPLFLLPPLFAGATLGVVAMAATSWRRRWWSAVHRAHYGLVAAVCITFGIVLFRWGFLG